MKKSYRITIIVLAAVLLVGALVCVIVSLAGKSGGKDNDETTTSAVASDASTTAPAQAGTTAAGSAVTSTTAAAAAPSAEQLIGKWSDGANMSGFEFFSDGTAKVTYVNLTIPVINVPVNGTFNGAYSVSGNTVTTKFSIYTATIEDTYTFSVDGSALTLVNTENGKTSTYMKSGAASASDSTTSAASSLANSIIGTWVSSDKSVKYTFENGGKFALSNTDVSSTAASYSGVYIVENDKLTVQYTANGQSVTSTYNCSVLSNTLTLTDSTGTRTFTRDGSAAGSTDSSALLGKWMDGADMSGFEFKSATAVTVTYVNVTIPVVNIPINGSYDGSYTVSDGVISMNYSIYGSTINKRYNFSVSGSTLTLTDLEDGKTSTYMKQG